MGIEYKDYYKILGVSKSASDDEIRKSFRKLARQYHPDVAKNKANAEEKFKEINEAYEVLSDPEKRQKYDSLGPDWQSAGGFRPPPGWNSRPGRAGGSPFGQGGFQFEFGGTGFSDFFEQIFGAAGRGARGFRVNEYPGADGDVSSQRGQDVQADLLVTLEEALHGAVRPITLRTRSVCEKCGGEGGKCPACGGEGFVEKRQTFQVKIPAGVREGQKLRLAGKGEAGFGKGPAGDLYLQVRMEKHPYFRFENDQLHYELNLAPWEAVLGGQVSIPTLDGKVEIRIPAGTQSGQKMRVRGKGMPGKGGERGDLIVQLEVQVPTAISESERALWEQLKKTSSFSAREA